MHHAEEAAMSIAETVFGNTTDAGERIAAQAARAAGFARAGADRAAGRVAAVYGPVDLITEASLKLSALSHQYTSRLLSRQGAMLKGGLEEVERRLQRLARAGSLRQAVAGQVEDWHGLHARLFGNVRETWAIVAEAGRDVTRLATATYAGLLQASPRPRASARPPRKAPTRSARKAKSRRRAA
jgi:phasin family protein